MMGASVHQIGAAVTRRHRERRRREQRDACPFSPGDGATYGIGADSYPCTVREVSPSGHRVVVTLDDVRAQIPKRRVGAEPTKVFIPREDGRRMVFTRRKDGSYRLVGRRNYTRLSPGRRSYFDPSF